MKTTILYLRSASWMLVMSSLVVLATACDDSDTENNEDDMTEEPTAAIVKKGDTTLVSTLDELDALKKAGEGDYKYSVEDFFKNPEKSGFKISPNGEYLSYMAPYEKRMNIFIQKIGSEDAKRITEETDRDISGYFWANDNRLLFIKDAGGDENFKLYGVNKDGSNPKDLTPFDSVTIQIIDDLEEIPDEVIIGMNKRSKMLFEPYRLNIKTGDLALLAENTNPAEPIVGWMTDHDGKLRLAFKMTNGVETNLMYRETENDEWKTTLTTNFKESVSPLFFDFDNKLVYASSNLGRDKSAIVKFDPATGKEVGDVIFSHPDVDVGGLSYSKKRKVLTTISYTTDKRQRKFLDDESRQIYQRLEKDLGEYEIAVTDMNDDEDKFLIRTYSDRSLGAYYYYNMKTDELRKLVDVSPWIKEEDMATMKPITYKSRDGMTINGYLTLPKGKENAKNLPVVINPHGGPWARDNWGFNPEVQLLANRGYAVLQMNFRGSTGYGRKFWEASFREWGKTMQNDITDGVQWLIDKGIADPDRVAIYGGSYGGYATLAGVTYTPDLYACAVDYVGVSNLFTFMETIPPYWEPYKKMMYEMVGDPNTEDSLMMREASPVFHVAKITTPLLVVQGANDPRVNIDESDQIVRGLRDKGVDVPYMVNYAEGHGFRNEENRIEFYKVMTGFLAKHLKNNQAAG